MAVKRPARNLPPGIVFEKDRQRYKALVSWNDRRITLGRFDNLQDAKAARNIAMAEISRGTFIPPADRRRAARARAAAELAASISVSEWVETWLSNFRRMVEAGERSTGTLRSYRSTVDCHIIPRIGNMRLVDVGKTDIALLLESCATETVRRNVARTCSALFNAAVTAGAGGLEQSPVSVRMSKKRTQSLDTDQVATPEQVHALADAMPPMLSLTVLLAAWCALRQGEVLGLQRKDFEHLKNPERAIVHVRRQWNSKAEPPAYTPPKTKATRTIAIPAPLLPIIRKHLATHVRSEPNAPVFPASFREDAPLGQTTLDKAWRNARTSVGMSRFRFHDLRHTGLTMYAQAGATLAELLNRGGHTNVEVALRYQHATLERDRQLTAQLAQHIPTHP